MDESFVSTRLDKLIKDKKEYLKKMTNENGKKIQQEEIMFLERDVMPLVLSQSTILYWEVMKHVTQKIRQAVDLKCDAVLCFIPFYENIQNPYKIGIDNPRAQCFGDLAIDKMEVTVDILGAGGTVVEPVNLPLYEL